MGLDERVPDNSATAVDLLVNMLVLSRKCGIRVTYWEPFWNPRKDAKSMEQSGRNRALAWLDYAANESGLSVSREDRDNFADAADRFVVSWPTAYVFRGQATPQDQLLRFACGRAIAFERFILQEHEATPELFEALLELRIELDVLVEVAAVMPGLPGSLTAEVPDNLAWVKRFLAERLDVAEEIVRNLPLPKAKGLGSRFLDGLRLIFQRN